MQGYRRFGQNTWRSRSTSAWSIKTSTKSSTSSSSFSFRLFTTMLRPFAGLNYAASSFTQPTQDEEESQRCTLELITLPTSHFAVRWIEKMKANRAQPTGGDHKANPFAYQEGLTGLTNETRQKDAGVFSRFTSQNVRRSFVHALEAIQNPIAMDTFCLDEVETVMSEYETFDDDAQSCMSESMIVMSSLDRFNDISTDDSFEDTDNILSSFYEEKMQQKEIN